MSTFSIVLADEPLSRFSNGDCELRLHVGNPGVDGTENFGLLGSEPAVGKPIIFASPDNHPGLNARMVESTGSVAWTGLEITPGQEITHYSIWSEGVVLDIGAAAQPVITVGDGIVVPTGGVRVSVAVFGSSGPDPEPEPEFLWPDTPDEVGLTIPKESLLGYSGSFTITSGVFEGIRFDLNGNHINIPAGDNTVTFRNCWFKGGGFWNLLVREGSTAIVENCEIGDETRFGERGLGGDGQIIASDLYIHHVEDGYKMSPDSILEHSYIHMLRTSKETDPHFDGIQNDGGASNVIIRRVKVDVPEEDVTSSILIKTDLGEIDNILVEECFLNGGAYTLFVREAGGRSPTNIVFRDCVLGPDNAFGYLNTDVPVTWDNMRDVNGDLILI